jgi:2-oxoisovalerate dehydrogenase E1 component alpha subunit
LTLSRALVNLKETQKSFGQECHRLNVVAQFEIPYYQYLSETSTEISKLPDFALNRKHLLQLYRFMVLIRTFDNKAIALQRTGKLGTYPSTRGQEAVFVGIGAAMAPNDVLVPYYRDVGALIQRSAKLSDILLFWGGDERGNCYSGKGMDLPYSVPVGGQPLHAAGIATAIQIKQQKRAVLTVCGDGATSQGDFYEALNLAGCWKLPLVFVINNNQWAISVPRQAQSGAKTLAQKAIAAGIRGEQVDGNDVIAVQARVQTALENARENQQPTLIEAISYRHSDHTTADDATRYEAKEQREQAWTKEPINRLRLYLENIGIWSANDEFVLQTETAAEVDKEVETYLNAAAQPAQTIFDYLYQQLPEIYLEQRERVIRKEGIKND